MKLIRIAILLCLGTAFTECLHINHGSPYVPFGFDVYHLSSLGAWICAGATGAFIFGRRRTHFSDKSVDAAARAMWEVWQDGDLCRDEHKGISWDTMVSSAATNSAAEAYVRIGRQEARRALEAAFSTPN